MLLQLGSLYLVHCTFEYSTIPTVDTNNCSLGKTSSRISESSSFMSGSVVGLTFKEERYHVELTQVSNWFILFDNQIIGVNSSGGL